MHASCSAQTQIGRSISSGQTFDPEADDSKIAQAEGEGDMGAGDAREQEKKGGKGTKIHSDRISVRGYHTLHNI